MTEIDFFIAVLVVLVLLFLLGMEHRAHVLQREIQDMHIDLVAHEKARLIFMLNRAADDAETLVRQAWLERMSPDKKRPLMGENMTHNDWLYKWNPDKK